MMHDGALVCCHRSLHPMSTFYDVSVHALYLSAIEILIATSQHSDREDDVLYMNDDVHRSHTGFRLSILTHIVYLRDPYIATTPRGGRMSSPHPA